MIINIMMKKEKQKTGDEEQEDAVEVKLYSP